MRVRWIVLCLLYLPLAASGQQVVNGVVADSITRQPLAFASVKVAHEQKGVITAINGRFSLAMDKGISGLTVSYVGYRPKFFLLSSLRDTLFISADDNLMNEVVIRPDFNKIKHILNTAIRNKPLHNPEMYSLYDCHIYYKMKVDLLPVPEAVRDSLKATGKRPSRQKKKDGTPPELPVPDTGFTLISDNNHIIFSESYSRRTYKRPQQLQEVVIASRFSGLKKTYFTNLVTDVLPFHIYGDFITLNGRDYLSPISKGWQQRYDFRLIDQIEEGNDTTYILSFAPKRNQAFNGLTGTVYINTNGYAISHFTASDASKDREVRIEQIYNQVNGRWFPRELNYDLMLKAYPSPNMGMKLNGHSVIDQVSFDPVRAQSIDKTYPVKLADSVDRHTEAQWEQFRPAPITEKEQNTYRLIDSLSVAVKLEDKVYSIGKIGLGKLPVSVVDIDITRLVARNDYEGYRLGIGLSTNNRISRYFSLGGWFGYGTRDKAWKYGSHLRLYPTGNTDNWIQLAYQNDYQPSGIVRIHPELDRTGYRNWILSRVDRVKGYTVTAHTQLGYWQLEPGWLKQELQSLYDNNFEYAGKPLSSYSIQEGNLGIRYAYGEKRVPVFEYYLPVITKFPIVYAKASLGSAVAEDYNTRYWRALAGITFKKHINRWGNDMYRLEGGMIRSFTDQPFPRSLLLAGSGFRSGVNYYATGGFITMRPYDYFNDRYLSFLYRHDFDKQLWKLSFSRPYISTAHNLIYGALRPESRAANADIVAPVKGYHESGLMLNQLLQIDFRRLAYIYINAGAFYHWAPVFDWHKNSVWVIGVSAGF